MYPAPHRPRRPVSGEQLGGRTGAADVSTGSLVGDVVGSNAPGLIGGRFRAPFGGRRNVSMSGVGIIDGSHTWRHPGRQLRVGPRSATLVRAEVADHRELRSEKGRAAGLPRMTKPKRPPSSAGPVEGIASRFNRRLGDAHEAWWREPFSSARRSFSPSNSLEGLSRPGPGPSTKRRPSSPGSPTGPGMLARSARTGACAARPGMVGGRRRHGPPVGRSRFRGGVRLPLRGRGAAFVAGSPMWWVLLEGLRLRAAAVVLPALLLAGRLRVFRPPW